MSGGLFPGMVVRMVDRDPAVEALPTQHADVLEEVQQTQSGFEDLQAPIDKVGAELFLNQNSREPVTEPDEMVPLWKMMHLAGADWTYGSKGWAAENYCMFMADNESWEKIVRIKAKAVDDLGCKVWLNTE